MAYGEDVGNSGELLRGQDGINPASPSNPLPTAIVGGGTGGSQRVEGVDASGTTATARPIAIGGKAVSAPLSAFVTAGQRVEQVMSLGGTTYVTLMTGAGVELPNGGTNVDGVAAGSGASRLDFRSFGYRHNGASFDREKKPNLTSRLISAAASVNATSVKATAGDVFKITGKNTNAAARYLKLYNKASAPTVGTDVPFWTEELPAQSKFELSFPTPMYFSVGIAYAITTQAADADATALTAGDVTTMNIAYA